LEQTATTTVVQTRDARLPMPGSLIVKNYKAQTVVVKVLNEGFEYDGRRFASLSAIAGVGAVLRHRDPMTIAHYAKVDFGLLSEIAQPWPEASSC
jgi:hypothetical protein